MMNSAYSMITKIVPALLLALSLLSPAAWATDPDRWLALTNATVHPVSGPSIEQATVLIHGERIAAVGTDVEVPEEATVVDLSGLQLYPGFVHPATQLGLTEISSVAGTVDTAEMGQINAATRVEVAVNHDSELLLTSVTGGVLTAHIVPGGGLIRGSSAIMNLYGWSWEEMVVSAPAGQHIAFPPGAVNDPDNDDLKLIERVLDQARHWHQAMASGQRPPRNDQLESLGPLLAGEVPLMLHANRADRMIAALDWAERQGFEHVILVATSDVQYIADRLAADNIPVILQNVYALPTRRHEAYDMSFVAPAVLAEAGVRFAIADAGSGMDVSNARNLPFQAGSAAAHGLSQSDALKSVTLWPAEILGVGDQLGSIEVGKRAHLIATNGDPLEPSTRIEAVWMDGQNIDLSRERGRRLFERYRDRPAGR